MIISNTDDGNRLPPERRRKQAAKKIAATRKDNRAAKGERVNEAGPATPAEEAASPATAYEPLLDALLIPPPKGVTATIQIEQARKGCGRFKESCSIVIRRRGEEATR